MSALSLAEKYAEDLGGMPLYLTREIRNRDLPGQGCILYSPKVKLAAVFFPNEEEHARFAEHWVANLQNTVKFASFEEMQQSSKLPWFKVAGYTRPVMPENQEQLARMIAPVLAFSEFHKSAYVGLDMNNIQYYGNAAGNTGLGGVAIPPINQAALNSLVQDPQTVGLTEFQRDLASTLVNAASKMPGGKQDSNFVTIPQFANLGAGLGVSDPVAALAGAGLGMISNFADRKLREIQRNGLLATAINTFTGGLLGGK